MSSSLLSRTRLVSLPAGFTADRTCIIYGKGAHEICEFTRHRCGDAYLDITINLNNDEIELVWDRIHIADGGRARTQFAESELPTVIASMQQVARRESVLSHLIIV